MATPAQFRQPFVAKTKYFEAKGTVMKVNREIDEDEVAQATIHFEYTDIDPEDKAALDAFVDDLEGFSGEVKKD